MAEFALGLTKTAVEGTLSRVKSAIEEETKLRVLVQNDLMFITGEFQMMQSFLRVASTERVKNEVVRTWVRQIRDLAFDVEDCVEFVVHLDNESAWSWFWRVVPSFMAPERTRQLDMAVADIKQLKARVEDVSQRNTRYSLISDSDAGSKPVASSPLDQQLAAADDAATAFHALSEVWEARGKLRRTGDLRKLITCEGSDLQVVSLWSSTSAGAVHHPEAASSYIIKKAYDDPEICNDFKSRAWIKLIHPFNPDKFLKSLVTQFYATSSEHQLNAVLDFQKKMKAEVATTEYGKLMQQLSEQRYLVIVEDVSTVAEWNAIRMFLPDSNNGSRVIVSTQHLRIALMCTGEPYQVSHLTRFSDGQNLCAFSTKGSVRRSDLGEFIWRLRCGGVISVLLDHGDSLYPISGVYNAIAHKSKQFDEVVFDAHSWVDVPSPFDMNAFAVSLFLNFQSRDFEAKEIATVGMMGEQGVIQQCCKNLREVESLVVINGLESMVDWDKMKATFLSKPTKGSIIVITKDANVAAHCAVQRNSVFNYKDIRADEALNRLLEKSQSGDMEDPRRANLFYDIWVEKDYWTKKFKREGQKIRVDALQKKLQNPGVISMWGPSGIGKSSIIREIYYEQVMEPEFDDVVKLAEAISLVDVPHPFNLTDFSWRLLLEFYSNDLEAKKATAVGLMKGKDPVQACRDLLCQHKFLIFIDGLRSIDDWDEIRASLFLSEHTQRSHIIVITNEETVARYCVGDEEDRLLKVELLEAGADTLSFPEAPHFFVGRNEELDDLCSFKAAPGVTSLWGVAGVGKSVLARISYSMHKGNRDTGCRPYKSSWVDVPHPFHLTELSRRLLLGYHRQDLQAKETAAVGIVEGQDTIQACCQFLREYSGMVVFDGIRSTRDWDLIQATFLSEPAQYTCIVVVTTEAKVATHCAFDKNRVLNIKGLNTGDALDLFTKIGWGAVQLDPGVMKLSEDIIANCGGLPKIISAVAEYASQYSCNLEDIHDDFMGQLETVPSFHGLKGLFTWMQSYFDACSDSLKPCIFYLPIFPGDHKTIRRRRLLRRWIAEGYSRDTSDGCTAEENGKMLFDELVELSIIQLADNVCQVNGFFREYILSRPMEDNLVCALEGRCSLNSQRAGQHLTIRCCWDRDEIVFRSMDFTRLRSLTVFGKWMPFFISADIDMRLLRVLDLEDTLGVKDGDLEKIGKLVPRLKFLSLRGCKDITCLTDSFSGFRQLQTLDIRGTKIRRLPRAICKLVKLQYVRAGTTHKPSAEGLPAAHEGASTLREIGDVDPSIATVPEDDDGAGKGQSAAADGDGSSTSHPPAATLCDRASTNQPAYLPAGGAPTALSDSNGASTGHPIADEDQTSTTLVPWRSRSRDLVLSYSCGWLSKRKKLLVRGRLGNDHVVGVEVPAMVIGNLTVLHTLGVINVGSGTGGEAILKEVKKLTQLHKLGVCGVNGENWNDFCCAISGHGYLESLSVYLDKEELATSLFSCSGDMFSNLPKTLKNLKMYSGAGNKNVQVHPVLIKQLSNLTKVNIELTISTQEEIDSLMADLPNKAMFRHLCIKPIQDGELRYGRWEGYWRGGSFSAPIKIDCGGYRLAIVFGPFIPEEVEVLVVHCSTTEASLEVSGLEELRELKEVRVQGFYSDAVKQHLQEKVAEVELELGRKVVLKLEERHAR